MHRQCTQGIIRLAFVLLLMCSVGQGQPQKATVHLRIVDNVGHDLGEPKVTEFKSKDDAHDFATRFRQGSATQLPFGIYKLRVYTHGFWSSEREVRVFQPDVWVVVSLELGMGKLEGGLSTYALSGSVRNLPVAKQPAWLRLSGVYSAVVIDARTGEAGRFSMAGIPQGLYVLVTTQNGKVLDARPVRVPLAGALEIELAK